jgi:hypothetical protein
MRWGIFLVVLVVALAIAWVRRSHGDVVILAVGESTTAMGGAQGWAPLLEGKLRAVCPSVRLQRWAVSGSDTSDVAARLAAGLSLYRPSAAILMIGANDRGNTADVEPADAQFFAAGFRRVGDLESALLAMEMSEPPQDDRRYSFRFLQPLIDDGRLQDALGMNEKVLVAHPQHRMAMREEIHLLRLLGRDADARKWHDKLASLAPGSPLEQAKLLEDLVGTPEFAPELARLRKAFPKSPELEFALSSIYGSHGKLAEQEKVLRGILTFCGPREKRVALELLRANLWHQGKHDEASRLEAAGPFVDVPVTERNYKRVVEQLGAAGVPFFSMQYPMRDPAPLRAWTAGAARAVISNQENFADAYSMDVYDRLFLDRFAGDTGHFKPEAAERVAAAAAGPVLEWLKGSGECR